MLVRQVLTQGDQAMESEPAALDRINKIIQNYCESYEAFDLDSIKALSNSNLAEPSGQEIL